MTTSMESSSPAIRVQELCFSWPSGAQVLKSCSLDVPKGEFWMLLGSNGSGKSTLLRLLAGLLQSKSGEIQLQGRVGFVFQNPDHQLVMPTVGADVAFGLVEDKLPWIEVKQRVEDALTAVKLLELQRRPIYALSGGQKQRIAIAGALARHCQVLLLDEPTALLDPDSQNDLVIEVQRLVKTRGITALWVTHRLEELNYSDGAFLLENGQVVGQGDPEPLKRRLMQKELKG
ncbi:energy-coupling factor ABC transporter ATP-binding protein [Planktothrix agardhii]|uniref:Cobalt/nickel transport system ATP-binding protein n=3 Tax=Planktothrix agardhii TaxID=1160 RepID=A0A073CV50_PLAA1|nr:energy-coupling factor ABC transporter ATP-binding protein [Planktothrix agardhii]MCF3606433.1 energy-coupling factor ABC transporter ATP-binding protein [Planktothrix agardhii 1033]KEI67845.1 cobalt/nickel transport system ATP-binding protein [Planktothrix agardhii NIVA-CYA 126/8]MBG0745034.1 energy-coupling factor ABC transporter ATP-binding protein [Planktothrix agardhii KL2]MCB8750569.1 energy-coupling factor ABC transporter ATP-binding protein [Planktothrix agardhii 1810]MCB8759331.1 e